MSISSKELFQRLFKELTLPDREENRVIVMLVIENMYGLTHAEIMAGKEIDVDDVKISKVMERLHRHEPVQYILGETEFYGRKFEVTSSVLIPRPETELLIDYVRRLNDVKERITILDVGTGSGCIAISLALEIQTAIVYATDVSVSALKLAEKNAKQLGAHVDFSLHDILQEGILLGPLDFLVSNPPYIPLNEKDSLQKNVAEFEPPEALFVPDANPLLFYEALANKAIRNLKPGGFLVTEIHESFGHQISELFQSVGLEAVEVLTDLNDKDRFVSGQMPNR